MEEFQQLPPGKSGGILDVDDLLLAPVRGAEGLLRGTVGLIDMFPGIDTKIGSSPKLLGDSDTLVGGFIEGASQFILGFIPLFGSLGTLNKAMRGAHILGRSNAITQSARFLTATSTRRGMLAGAGVDFGGFDGNEDRLSDFLETYPALQNPVTEFLAADPDDPEVVGRLKNAIEGLGLGLVTDVLLPGLRGIHQQRSLVAKGMDPDDAAKLASENVQETVSKMFKEALEEEADRGDYLILEDGERFDLRLPVNNKTKLGQAKKFANVIGVDVDEFLRVHRDIDKIIESGEIPGFPEYNPKNMTREEILLTGLEKTDWNATNTIIEQGSSATIRVLEKLGATTKSRKITQSLLDALTDQSLQRLATVAAKDPVATVRAWNMQAQRAGSSVYAAMVQANATRVLMRKVAGEMYDTVAQLAKGGLDDSTKASLESQLQNSNVALASLRDSAGILERAMGQSLRSLGFQLGDNLRNVEEVSNLLLKGGDPEDRKDLLKMVLLSYDRGTDADIAGLQRFLKASPGRRMAVMGSHYFINSILAGPRTLVLNVMSPLLYKGYTMGAESVGGVGQLLASRGKNSQVLQGLWAELGGMWQGLGDGVKIAMKSARFQQSQFTPDSAAPFTATSTRREWGRSPFQPEAFGVTDEDSILYKMIGWADFGINMPLRLSRAGDDLTKQIIGRGKARSLLTREGLEQGFAAEELESFVSKGMEKMFWEGQIFSEDTVRRKAIHQHNQAHFEATEGQELPYLGDSFAAGEKAVRDYKSTPEGLQEFNLLNEISEAVQAHTFRQTFTEELSEGSVTRKIQQALVAHPLLKVFLPFVQTPTNLLREGLDNFAPLTAARVATTYLGANTLNFWRKDGRRYLSDQGNRLVAELRSPDKNVRWEAGGRLATSFAFTTLAINWALEGRLTGAGPKDPEHKEILQSAGWQPYSLRTDALPGEGSAFVQFGRLDPLAATLGIVADFTEALRAGDEQDLDETSKTFAGIMAAVSGLMSEKSYFLGIKNFIETFTDPHAQSEKSLGMLLGAAVPNYLAQVAQAHDPILRDLEGAVDSLRYRIPTLESLDIPGRRALAPQRNILGEQIKRSKSLGEDTLGSWFNMVSPVMYREVKDNVIAEEMASLSHGFAPPKKIIRGVNLREIHGAGHQDAYDRWQQLTGTTQIGGRTLKQALRKLFKSKAYQNMDPVSTLEYVSPRVREIRKVLSRYRQRALTQVQREIPELRDALREAARASRDAQRRGGFDALKQLQGGLPTFTNPISEDN